MEIKVNNKTLSYQKVALYPDESKLTKFAVIAPREGSYTVSIGGLSKDFRVEKGSAWW